MLIEDTTGEQLEALVNEHVVVLVDFWAPWCAPCKAFAIAYEQVAQTYKDIAFAKVNIDKHPDLAELFEIRSIPHLVVFKQGVVIYSESGSMPEKALIELVEQAKTVDLDEQGE